MEKLDVEYFQKLAYNRSKTWSTFLANYESEEITQLENIEDDMDVREVEDFLNSADDNDMDDLSSMEDDDCQETVNSEFLKNASNTSQFCLFIANAPADLSAITKNEEERQYADVINKTLPVLHEHERQLQEFGFDKVLTSFNKDEIEDKFGSWLNRHNSLFGGDNTLHNWKKNLAIEKAVSIDRKPRRARINSVEKQDTDSDGSLQSGETARYIRSSKVKNVKNCTSTMIKTYRRIKTTREALREKYSCRTDEDGYHRNGLKIRKKLESLECLTHYEKTPVGRSHKYERIGNTTRSHRRKVLRKRINSHDCNGNYSSSDSEYTENYNCKNLKVCCKHNHCGSNFCNTPVTPKNKIRKLLSTRCGSTKLISAYRNRVYYISPLSSSSTASSSSFIAENRRAKRRLPRISNDERPCKRESECCCFKDKMLCKEFKHVADSSTEEWYVDNGCAAKKQLKTPVNNVKNSQQPKSNRREALQTVNKIELNENKAENKNNFMENKSEENTLKCESSDSDLKYALKLSIESYHKEQEVSSAQKGYKTMSIKSNRKILPIKQNVSEEESIMKNKTLSQNTGAVTKKRIAVPDMTSPARRSNEDTFFGQIENQEVCNSTALSAKGQAYKRQLTDKTQECDKLQNTVAPKNSTVIDLKKNRKKQKSTSKKLFSTRTQKENSNVSATVTSTTVRSPVLHLTSTLNQSKESKSMEQSDEKNCTNQIDCADVTSTTSMEVPRSKKTNNETERSAKKNLVLNSDDDFFPNSILIYAPDNQNMVSAADGYFTVTQEHLSTFLGERGAQKFIKYYAGRRRFRTDSMVYYKPPIDRSVYQNSSTSSESTDEMDHIGEYGVLFAITK